MEAPCIHPPVGYQIGPESLFQHVFERNNSRMGAQQQSVLKFNLAITLDAIAEFGEYLNSAVFRRADRFKVLCRLR